MDTFFKMLHIIGIVLWFGTIAADLALLPAAKKSGDVQLKAWAYRMYGRMLWVDVVGLGLLLAGGIGMLVVRQWWPWEFGWLHIKFWAAIFLLVTRLWVYMFFYQRFRMAAIPAGGGELGRHVESAIKTYDAFAKGTAAFVLGAIVVLFWMVFWKPVW